MSTKLVRVPLRIISLRLSRRMTTRTPSPIIQTSPALSSTLRRSIFTDTQHRDSLIPFRGSALTAIRWFQNESDFHSISDRSLEDIQDALDDCFDGKEKIEYELTLAAGVLTISLPPHGTWVLNKQTPNRQIWWSSPLSGPKRFEHLDNVWCSTKDGLLLGPLLSQELSHVLKLPEGSLAVEV